MKLEEIKKDAIENHIPIIMDDTFEIIKQEMEKREIHSILEIGTAVGYSSLKFKELLNKDGFIDTIERDEIRIEQAKKNIEDNKEIRPDVKINIHTGDAIIILEELYKNNNKYDMVFIDAAKSKYPLFLDYSLKMLNENGIIFADNVLFKGYVLSDYNKHKHRTAVTNLRKFLKEIEEDKTLKSEVLDIGDGLAIIERKV